MATSPTGRESPAPPIAAPLLNLAPLRLPHRRSIRYQGDDLCVPIEQFAARDQALLRNLYVILSELLYDIANDKTRDAEKWAAVSRWIRQHSLDTLFADVRSLGQESLKQGHDEEMAKALHDVRGGALSALLGRLQIYERLPHDEALLKILFILARDHLKIMRNAILGLDETRREADKQRKSHDIKLILEKWQDSVVGANWHERPVRLSVDCRYEGALTECCLESAAVDRIFYNLANNASRHAAGDRVEMAIFPLPEPSGECVRFVLANGVSEEDAARLRVLGQPGDGADGADESCGLNLRGLFEPGKSSTGSGFGLTVVADFVAGAFGLRDRAEALRERYVGARLDGNTFRVWFHWLAGDGTLPPKLDDFHQPQRSLSEPAGGEG